MTPEDFYELDEMEQAEAIWDGVMIADRFDDVYRVVLYQVKNIYVEAYYNMEHNFIRGFRAFDDLERLDIYLEKMKIEEFRSVG